MSKPRRPTLRDLRPAGAGDGELAGQIVWHEEMGSSRRRLGIQPMPPGYALMWNGESHYYWLRRDGAESAIHWSRWAVYRWAWNDFQRETET